MTKRRQDRALHAPAEHAPSLRDAAVVALALAGAALAVARFDDRPACGLRRVPMSTALSWRRPPPEPVILAPFEANAPLRLRTSRAALLREHPTMPADPQNQQKPWLRVSGGGHLPPVSCAFAECQWHGGRFCEEQAFRDYPEHPWDQELRTHVLDAHADGIAEAGKGIEAEMTTEHVLWDVYREAIAVIERRGIPVVGPSVDRRATDHLVQRFNDQRIKGLVCFCCAQVKPDTGGCRSAIEFKTGRWLCSAPATALWNTFALEEFQRRYCQPGSALSPLRTGDNTNDIRGTDFTQWQVRLTASAVQQYVEEQGAEHQGSEEQQEYQRRLQYAFLLCCPEDQECHAGCATSKSL